MSFPLQELEKYTIRELMDFPDEKLTECIEMSDKIIQQATRIKEWLQGILALRQSQEKG